METHAIEASPVLPASLSILNVRTQKARGIAALAKSKARILVPRFEVFPADKVQPEQLVGYFSRPCPMRPRHGFVDSRTIRNVSDGIELIRQTLEADPEAEIVTMPLINAEYSGVWTPGLLTIGNGNDGATAGQSSWSLPTLGSLVREQILQDAGVEGTPYVELLWPRGNDLYRLVQLRDGPALPQTINFIPQAMTVERIVHAKGDLLAWEREMQATKPGTVVYHPNGSLASHYAIHAVLNRVPVLVDREPRIGDVLEPEGVVFATAPDLAVLRAGFQLALRLKVSYEDAAHVMLTGCHHLSVWTGKHDDLLGLALGFAYRLTVVAALGEMRHVPKGGKMRRTDICRTDVYDEHWQKVHHPETRLSFEEALRSFHGLAWVQSYGGAMWFFFAKWAAMLRNHLVEGNTELALQALNQLVHCAHNNGWAFNKFVPEATMSECALDPVSALVLCVPVLRRAHKTLCEHRDFLARHFMSHVGLLQIPLGAPCNVELEVDEERRYDDSYNQEETLEPMAGKRIRPGRSRIRRPDSRGVSVTIVF